jgi:hypothetical protein
MTSTEGNTMFSLAVYTVICTGLGAFLLIRWWIDRHWNPAGRKAEALADLSTPTVDEHAAQAIAVVREKGSVTVRGWHTHPCGCWCGPDTRKRVCPKHALEVQEIRDLLTWERERHQP